MLTIPINRYAPTARDASLLPFQLTYFDTVTQGNFGAINVTYVNPFDFIAVLDSVYIAATGGGVATITSLVLVVLNDGDSVAASAQLQTVDRVTPAGAQIIRKQVPVTQVLLPPGGGLQLQAGYSAADAGNLAHLSCGGFSIPRGNFGI